MTVPRDRVALKKGAVPSIFPNCPSYLSGSNSKPKRLSKDDKERLMMETAYTQSLTDNEETVDKFLIDSFSDLLSKLHLIDLRNGWISHHSEDNSLHFLKILITDSGPIIERSVLIDHDLFIRAFGINNIPICISRISINDTRQIESSLYEVDNFSTPTRGGTPGTAGAASAVPLFSNTSFPIPPYLFEIKQFIDN